MQAPALTSPKQVAPARQQEPTESAPKVAPTTPAEEAKQASDSCSGPISLVCTNVFPGEEGRDQQLRACRMIDTPPEPRFDAITKWVLGQQTALNLQLEAGAVRYI